MSINSLSEGAELVSRLLRCPVEDALRYSREVPEIDAFFYWQPVRGGAQLLVARDGSVMFGISALPMAEMINLFKSGERTDPSEFEVD
jgi:hypothetical protein